MGLIPCVQRDTSRSRQSGKLWDTPHTMDESLATRLARLIEARGLTARAVSLAAGLSATAVRDIVEGRSKRPLHTTIRALSEQLNVSTDYLTGTKPISTLGVTVDDAPVSASRSFSFPGIPKAVEGPKTRPRQARADDVLSSRIPEIDVRAGMVLGGTAFPSGRTDCSATDVENIVGLWELPPDYLHRELRTGEGAARIIEVQGDSMEPLLHPGDRVMINLHDRTPSPPGIFAVWDGIGILVKRLEFIPNSDPPSLVISSDNPKHRTYERTADEIVVIGRIVWFARRV